MNAAAILAARTTIERYAGRYAVNGRSYDEYHAALDALCAAAADVPPVSPAPAPALVCGRCGGTSWTSVDAAAWCTACGKERVCVSPAPERTPRKSIEEFFATLEAEDAAMGEMETLLRDAAAMAGQQADLPKRRSGWHEMMLRLEAAANRVANLSTPPVKSEEVEVFSLPECIFNYCPSEAACKANGCQQPAAPLPQPDTEKPAP